MKFPPFSLPRLRVQGAHIVTESGQPVRLRGVCIGGWMNMENFITGFPGTEQAQREAVLKVLGREKYEFFFDRFLEYFFTESDARFIASLGMNVVRLAVNYRHLEDDDNPGIIKEAGFNHLDRIIDLCAREGIYSIVDLHSAPGGQSEGWHCDNPTHLPLFWRYREFQDRMVRLWEFIARRYQGNPAVAGFNLLNEPHDPSKNQLRPFYQRVIEAIRAVDPEPVIFLDGNRFATDFTHFDPPFENAVYSIHDYPAPGGTGAVDYPGIYGGELVDKEKLRSNIRRMCQYMIDRNLPIWVGEFGSHYTEDPVIDARRRQVALDQIAAFEELEAHWCLWPYKNIGVQDVVHLAPDSPWVTRVKPILEKKARLCVDLAFPGTAIQPLLQPIEDLMTREFPEYDPPPWGAKSRIGRLMRSILLSDPLIPEFADLFKAMSETEIDEMMKSFLFERCIPRKELAASLKIICGARETN